MGIFSRIGISPHIGQTLALAHLKPSHCEDYALFKSVHDEGGYFPCPVCGGATSLDYMVPARCVDCMRPYSLRELSKQDPVFPQLGDFSPPDDAELTWAQATMPGKATGHITGYRTWRLDASAMNTPELFKLPMTDLIAMSAADLSEQLQKVQSDLSEMTVSGLVRLTSLSSSHVWEPGKPAVAIAEANMPRAHGAGIYAMKYPMQSMLSEYRVSGEVALWGDVVEHTNGYRARYAYPTRLWINNEKTKGAHIVAQSLEQAYGCSCHIIVNESNTTPTPVIGGLGGIGQQQLGSAFLQQQAGPNLLGSYGP